MPHREAFRQHLLKYAETMPLKTPLLFKVGVGVFVLAYMAVGWFSIHGTIRKNHEERARQSAETLQFISEARAERNRQVAEILRRLDAVDERHKGNRQIGTDTNRIVREVYGLPATRPAE